MSRAECRTVPKEFIDSLNENLSIFGLKIVRKDSSEERIYINVYYDGESNKPVFISNLTLFISSEHYIGHEHCDLFVGKCVEVSCVEDYDRKSFPKELIGIDIYEVLFQGIFKDCHKFLDYVRKTILARLSYLKMKDEIDPVSEFFRDLEEYKTPVDESTQNIDNSSKKDDQ